MESLDSLGQGCPALQQQGQLTAANVHHWERSEGPWRLPDYTQLISNKTAKNLGGWRRVFIQIMVGQLGFLHRKQLN